MDRYHSTAFAFLADPVAVNHDEIDFGIAEDDRLKSALQGGNTC
jgi:hypothetical protein